jgi:hypothetical protein
MIEFAATWCLSLNGRAPHCGEQSPKHGVRSSRVERPAVDREVAGSKPVGHPNNDALRVGNFSGWP